jgi:simple sugar transport system ATP-binding protein
MPIVELKSVSKRFGPVQALTDISLDIHAGEVHCLLGDNGAGKSTLIKILAGFHAPTSGEVLIDGIERKFDNPREAQAVGIATVYQDAGSIPLMSVAQNFFLGSEPVKGFPPFRYIDRRKANQIALSELHKLGITRVKEGDQLVGTLSGGERQSLAIARALYFGAKVLILDEPTSALGVKEAGVVLRLMDQARAAGAAIVFITHNAHHAMHIGDRFTVLIQGAVAAQFVRGEKSREDVINLMAGGEELESLELELELGSMNAATKSR